MRALVLLAVALAITAAAPAPRLDLDLSGRESGHALLTLGFVTFNLAFDFGHECSNPDGCGGAIL